MFRPAFIGAGWRTLRYHPHPDPLPSRERGCTSLRSPCAPFVLRTFPPRAGATLLPRRCFFAHCGTSQRRAGTPCGSLRFPRPAFGCLGFAKGTFAHPLRSPCAPFVLRTFPPRAGATLLPRRCFLRIAALLSGARSPPAGRFASRVLPLGAWASRRGRFSLREGDV